MGKLSRGSTNDDKVNTLQKFVLVYLVGAQILNINILICGTGAASTAMSAEAVPQHVLSAVSWSHEKPHIMFDIQLKGLQDASKQRSICLGSMSVFMQPLSR